MCRPHAPRISFFLHSLSIQYRLDRYINLSDIQKIIYSILLYSLLVIKMNGESKPIDITPLQKFCKVVNGEISKVRDRITCKWIFPPKRIDEKALISSEKPWRIKMLLSLNREAYVKTGRVKTGRFPGYKLLVDVHQTLSDTRNWQITGARIIADKITEIKVPRRARVKGSPLISGQDLEFYSFKWEKGYWHKFRVAQISFGVVRHSSGEYSAYFGAKGAGDNRIGIRQGVIPIPIYKVSPPPKLPPTPEIATEIPKF